MAKQSRKKTSKKPAAGTARKPGAAKSKAGKKGASKSSKSSKGAKPSRPAKEKTGRAKSAGTTKTKLRASTAKKPRRPKASGLAIKGQHVDFLTYKVDQVRKFYEDTLELKTESRDADGLNYVVVGTSEQSSIGFMPPHPEMRGEQPLPREPTLYFVVRDVDKAYTQLLARGVAFMGPPQEMPWGHRVITTTDPEGRTVMLAGKMKAKKR